eukprot:GFUD01004885.1.p1 GENE.GFUD01004885.1~~GFUD01004885.1.p1  ORF type:complete len:133 (-),score=24.23 GFUD01004885.1:389-751(-)
MNFLLALVFLTCLVSQGGSSPLDFRQIDPVSVPVNLTQLSGIVGTGTLSISTFLGAAVTSTCPQTLPCKDLTGKCCRPYVNSQGELTRCPKFCVQDFEIVLKTTAENVTLETATENSETL